MTDALVLGLIASSALVIGTDRLAFALAIAGGAVLASLADPLMPEASEHGRPRDSLATTESFFPSCTLFA